VRDLGVELTQLKPTQLANLPLSDELLEIILQAQKIKQHGARRRQLQYLGKQLRRIDIEPLVQALTELRAGAADEKREHRRLEQTRNSLIEGEDGAFDAVLVRHPHADRRHLQQLIDKARREREQAQPPVAARVLFRYLRELAASGHLD